MQINLRLPERLPDDSIKKIKMIRKDPAKFEYKHIEMNDTVHFWKSDLPEDKCARTPAAP
ncbi:MAG: hypothetical protein IPL27_11940 [Lewinellaceae bacterium]|nr:hypothetical protein [Lewinellaceae bacterium]